MHGLSAATGPPDPDAPPPPAGLPPALPPPPVGPLPNATWMAQMLMSAADPVRALSFHRWFHEWQLLLACAGTDAQCICSTTYLLTVTPSDSKFAIQEP